ncbi:MULTISPECIES: histidine--tRNA ligase [Methanobacterium]|jgi:histidyl-tRNA synthetase|uniref:Histidine--tRNA ligase n=1 Tax=Methanobacterium veterum TaxID=408577 RepID=A0A9E4ZUR4_9EURY|nr:MULTISPECIES: histidine--tRNA ligase [Methanobacterium]MCZ3364742.1 histidine--tRNA ligase [Methanobacterium veterum]MCZ3372496.1 histidine--tRNA ligase [Methanobacterium veterum]
MEISRPRGTRDFLSDEMKQRKYVENTFRRVFENYGYGEIKTPIFEDLTLFTMKSGEAIKEEIYHFKDKGERDLALRPELTAPVSRLYLNELQRSPKPLKMYYFGSCFRYERPQAGRFRQFWQFGCELIGGKSPEAEAEVIAMAAHCLNEIGLTDYEFHIGNLGIIRSLLNDAKIHADEQGQIMGLVDKGDVEELENLLNSMDISESLKEILLKLIEIKGHNEVIDEVRSIIKKCEGAFKALDDLEDLLNHLETFGFTNYIVNLGIARGLDYYSGMVFEIYVHGLGAQKQISGGGTYNLIEIFGGEPVESTGFAFGFDRVMEALKKQNAEIPVEGHVDVFVAPLSGNMRKESFKIVQDLRKNGISADVDLARKKVKKLLSYADHLRVKYAVLVGARDIEGGKVTLKNMESGNQELVDLDNLAIKLRDELEID